MIDCYIEHQVEVITRRSQFDLKKAKARLHIVEGLVKACSIIDEVVQTIKSSKDKADARIQLINKFNFSEGQSEAILNLQLYRLSNLDILSLKNEEIELNKTISHLEGLLNSSTKMNNLIKSDLNKIKEKYGDPRRTLIEEQVTSFEVDKKALILKEEVMVSVTKDGYIKRSQLKSYKSSGESLPNIKLGDTIKGIIKANTTDTLILFTNFGNFVSVPVYRLKELKWKDEGDHINDISTLSPNEKIVSCVNISEFKQGVYVVILSKTGQIKRTPLYQFDVVKTNKPSKCFKLLQDDEVVSANVTCGNTKICILSDSGSISTFDESEVKTVGIKAGGIKGIKLDKESKSVVGFVTLEPQERVNLIAVTAQKGVRIVDSNNLKETARLGAKQNLFKAFKSDPHKAIYFGKLNRKEENNKINLLFENQQVVEVSLNDIKVMPLDNYLRANLEIDNVFNIVDIYSLNVPTITKDTKTYEPLIKDEIEDIIVKKVEKEDTYEQISLFDFIDDD